MSHLEYHWSHPIVIDYIFNKYPPVNRVTKQKIIESAQIMGGFYGIRNSALIQSFIGKLVNLTKQDLHLYTDFYQENFPEKNYKYSKKFTEHRHDQSVSSLLTKCLNMGIVIHSETYPHRNNPIVESRLATSSRLRIFFDKTEDYPLRLKRFFYKIQTYLSRLKRFFNKIQTYFIKIKKIF